MRGPGQVGMGGQEESVDCAMDLGRCGHQPALTLRVRLDVRHLADGEMYVVGVDKNGWA